MIIRVLFSHLLLALVLARPEDIRLPVLQGVATPEEINRDLQSTHKVQRSINDNVGTDNTEDTIREVERMIKANPDLPRLTRGEILDILDNITKHDQLNLIKSIPKDSSRDPKALMVVKAYTPYGSGEVNVEEFYTKPPVTTIIDDEDESAEEPPKPQSTTSAPHFRRKTTKLPEDNNPPSRTQKKPSRGNIQFRLSSTTVSSTEKITSTTEQPTTKKTAKRRRRPIVTLATTTQMSPTTYRPRQRTPPRKEIQYPNHKYPEVRPVYSASRLIRPPVSTPAPELINSELEDLIPQEIEHEETFIPVKKVTNSDLGKEAIKFKSVSEPSIELEIPEHLKKVVADLNLAAIKDPESVSMTSIVPKSEKEEADQIKQVLSSIGALPPTTSSTNEGLNANTVADSLSPEMQELLKSFGLLPNANDDSGENRNELQEFVPEKAEIDPGSFVGFKPLPEDTASRKEMEDLLTRFGLLDENNRKQKSKRKGKVSNPKQNLKIEQISLDAIPEEFKPVLREMGLDPRVGRKIREQPVIKTSEKSSEDLSIKKQHVFNPVDPNKEVSDEELRKLGRLLEIMRKLEKLNGTITNDEMEQIDKEELKELIESLNNQTQGDNMVPLYKQEAPNPVEDDLGSRKNEVKRQESSTSTTEKIETVTAETITEETKTPSIKDLEDSFGGSSDTVTEALPETTTAKRNGFYYLLDWNTFFEIDDQKGKRVNLRFQPKVGDPKRFYSVNVP